MTMTENEQIQEMEDLLYEIEQGFIDYCDKPCAECEHNKFLRCVSRYKAERLYAKGYRKIERGEWQKCFGNDTKIRTCSNCHISQTVNVYRGKVMFMYCPYCGSDMRGDQNA